MAQQASYKSPDVVVAGPELARRKTAPDTPSAPLSAATQKDLDEKEEVHKIVSARERYGKDRVGKEREWVESFKMYMSWVDKALNPFLSNLFIPKTHEAVELLSAFLIGTNQSISATPENGSSDTMKARVAGKWLDFLWRKTLKARIKILVWIKQGILFGNGLMKVGWDSSTNKPWMSVCAIEDVYFDFFEADIQDSELIIHEIRKEKEDVVNDEKYDLLDSEDKLIREQVIVGGESFAQKDQTIFSTFDGSMSRSECKDKVLVMEVWCQSYDGKPQLLKTLLPTSLGWRVARRVDNPNRFRGKEGDDGEQFRPFVKLRFKTAALPNRAYDMGAVYPSVHIQKAFNDLFRQYFDSVQLINNPMWRKRRGARINPNELVRRPGGVISMGDITKDLAPDVVQDVKQSIIEMLNRLDKEFQEASMVVNLVKGISQSNTATGDALAQQNVQTLLDMINENIVDALSELGQMVLAISLANTEGQQSLILYENEKETATLDFDPKNIDGMHDIRIVPDRSDATTKAEQNKALIDFTKLVGGDGPTRAAYPSLMLKIYKRFLDNSGVGDPDSFFQEEGPGAGAPPPAQGGADAGPKVSMSMSYKDAPDDIRREMEKAAGLEPSKGSVKSPADMAPTPADAGAPVLQ